LTPIVLGEDLFTRLYKQAKELEREIRHNPVYRKGVIQELREELGVKFTGEMDFSQLKEFVRRLEEVIEERGEAYAEGRH